MNNLEAYKMDGLGNDFIIFDIRKKLIGLTKEQIIKISDRNNALKNGTVANTISDFSNATYDNMTYANINDPGKQWIRKYTLALAKELLGNIRSKYSSIPVPGAEVNLDGDTLRSEAAAERENLITQLREDLEAASRRNLLERQKEESEFISWLEIENKAVVTSGDYERFVTINNVRHAHIIDPRNGYPSKGIKSVTVICPDAELADALATSVFVLGQYKGLTLINDMNNFECIIINDKDEIITSNGIDLQLYNIETKAL